MKKPFCSIVVLNYNGKEHLEECFTSVRNINYPKSKYEVIMVDNASKDGSVKFVRKKFPWVKIIQASENFGFCGGNNIGIANARGEYVMILNNDVRVDKNWLTELVKVMEADKTIGVAGSKVLDYYKPEIIQYAGSFVDITGSPFHRGLGEVDNGQYNKVEDVFYALDCSALYRKEALNSMNYYYDDSYFIQSGEVDLCWRLRYRDWRVVFVPKSVIYHKGGADSKKGDIQSMFLLYRNKIWTFKKNLSFPLRQIILALVCARTFAAMCYHWTQGNWDWNQKVFRHVFDDVREDADLSKISWEKQLSGFSFFIWEKYTQYFTGPKVWGKSATPCLKTGDKKATLNSSPSLKGGVSLRVLMNQKKNKRKIGELWR